MALPLNTVAQAIIARFYAENDREGDQGTKIEWTGNHQLRGDQLWIELKFIEPDYGTYLQGWVNGEERDGFLVFEEN